MTIFLCGFMGCGKTCAGEIVAERLELPFIDLDKHIEETCKMTISEMFRKYGEKHFRNAETNAIDFTGKLLSKLKGGVVALGGGAIITPENAALINKYGISVFIDVDFDVCYSRIKGDISRPLAVEKPRDKLEQLYNERKPLYIKHAQSTVDGNTDINTLSERIIAVT